MTNWRDIHPDFTEEITSKWINKGFSKNRVKEWLEIGIKSHEFDFANYLEETLWDALWDKSFNYLSLREMDWSNLDELRKKHDDLIKKQKWTSIHKDFAKKNWSNKTYQQFWEENGLTYQDAQEWITTGFRPDHYWEVKGWKEIGINAQQAQEWIQTKLEKKLVKQWIEAGVDTQQFHEWIQIGFGSGKYEEVNQWKSQGFDPLTAKPWIEIGFEIDEARKARQWRNHNFTSQQAKEWIAELTKFGLKPRVGYDFADYLKNVKEIGLQEIGINLDELKKEYNNTILGWIISTKSKSAEWTLKHGNEEGLKKEYEKFLEEVKKGSKLSVDTINQIKTFTQKPLISKLILNKTLNKRYKKYGLCEECGQTKIGYGHTIDYVWCQFCNLSGNPAIDQLIQKYQQKDSEYGALAWVPYNQFTNIEYLAEGGFGKVYRAKWIGKLIVDWNTENNDWQVGSLPDNIFVLKNLNNSQNTHEDFLREIDNLKSVESSEVVRCYGISQDPQTKDYIMVMQYIKDGNLRQYLDKNYSKLDFKNKIVKLMDIIRGLSYIHEQGLVHRDFHAGNILNQGVYNYITDLGLCRPANEKDGDKVYGVLPYVAPEVLSGEPYTQKADIYSFGVIAWEILSGLPPYHNLAHDTELILKIYDGLRPNLDNVQVPQSLKDLIKRCWDEDPKKRPISSELFETLNGWYGDIFREVDAAEFYQQYKDNKRSRKNWSSINK